MKNLHDQLRFEKLQVLIIVFLCTLFEQNNKNKR